MNEIVEKLSEVNALLGVQVERLDAINDRVSEMKGALDAHLAYCRDRTLVYTGELSAHKTSIETMKNRHKTSITLVALAAVILSAIAAVIAILFPR